MNTNFDLSTIPFANLTLIVVAIVIGLILMRRFGIKQIGPIKIDMEDNDSIASLNRKNDFADSNLKLRMRNYADEMGEMIEAALDKLLLIDGCDEYTELAIAALSSSLRFPFYNTISNNHFTTVLMPENIEAYKGRLLFQLQNRYHRIEKRAKGILPPYEKIEYLAEEWLDDFIHTLKAETVITCKEKIRNNDLYKKSIKSSRWLSIVNENEEKNKHYIKELER